MRRLNFTLTLLTLVSLTGAACAQIVIPPDVLEKMQQNKAEPKTPTSRPAGKKADLQRLVIDFRRADSVAKREAAADKLLKLGPRGTKILSGILAGELPRKTAEYKKAFYNQARSVGTQKYRATGARRIEKWRQQFRATGEITKNSLKTHAGPAMDSLYKALVPTRSEVLEAGKTLSARREDLISLDSIRAKCNDKTAAQSEFPKMLEQQETLIALMCAPMPDTNRKPIQTALKQFNKMSFGEWEAFVHLNVIRVLLGLRPMKLDLRLAAAGRDHSKDMHEKKFFSHQSPVSGKKTPWNRAARQGTKSNGECIASGMSAGPGAIRAWFFSPGHHKIIMSRSTRVGIGKHARKWTLMTG
ncbi:MAG: CAP domain-containing protein [Phycisphaerales bacterium]|nr:CAP domain-containing protein [Phycisphaerales bacterium]